MMAALELAESQPISTVCDAMSIPRASFYRWCFQPLPKPRPAPPRKLAPSERQTVLDILCDERFADQAPHEVYATLLDEGSYVCSIRTMYRILAENDQVRERRRVTRHGTYKKPELLATGPNQVWSWDITKLKGPTKWTYYYLYVIIDIFSRRVVGWCVDTSESTQMFRDLFEETLLKRLVAATRG